MPTLTITFPASAATRIQDALEETFTLEDVDGEPRAATMADFQDFVVNKSKQLVRASEHRVAKAAAAATVTELDVV
jgi:hypothetical protein